MYQELNGNQVIYEHGSSYQTGGWYAVWYYSWLAASYWTVGIKFAKKTLILQNYQKERYDWKFLLFGANIDAIKIAASFGISAERALKYCIYNEGIQRNLDAVSSVASCMRCDVQINES